MLVENIMRGAHWRKLLNDDHLSMGYVFDVPSTHDPILTRKSDGGFKKL